MHNIDKHTIKAIITEEINLLMEDRATDNRSKARKYARSKGVSDEEAKELDQKLMHDLPNLRLSEFKYMLGVTRMFLNNELTNGNDITKLNTYLKLLSVEPHLSEYDRDINGLTFNQLDEKFKTIQQDVTNKEREESLNTQFEENKDYDIVRIPDYETASKYGEYTDWCVTHTEAAYENYTGGGTGLFYFCLKKGFENVPEEEGPNSPLDDYGLSMIAVSVNMDGSPNTITSRWNHACGGSDSVMDYKELEKIIGRSFYATFKPYSREELHAKGVILFDEVQGLLDSGKKPEEVFGIGLSKEREGFRVVYLNGKRNYIDKNNKLLSDKWFSFCYDFSEGFGIVELNGKRNYLKPDGTLLSDTWFDYCYKFEEGFGKVILNDKRNYIKPNGTLLSDKWFDGCWNFQEGFGKVMLNGKYNYIKPDGILLSDKWFDECWDFHNGFGIVELDDRRNYIKSDGTLLSNTWFDICSVFFNGFGMVGLNGKTYEIDKDGNLKPIVNINEQKKKLIRITESQEKDLKQNLYMTRFKFKSNLKKFLKDLLTDPINAQVTPFFTLNGITKKKLISDLIANKIIIKKLRIDDQDKNGNKHTAMMGVKYAIPKKDIELKIDKMYDMLYGGDKKLIMSEEDGGGATSACSSGQYIAPAFGKKIIKR